MFALPYLILALHHHIKSSHQIHLLSEKAIFEAESRLHGL